MTGSDVGSGDTDLLDHLERERETADVAPLAVPSQPNARHSTILRPRRKDELQSTEPSSNPGDTFVTSGAGGGSTRLKA